MGKGEVKVREEKMSLLLERRSEAPESRIQGPEECERQIKVLPVWATNATDADLDALVQ